MFLTIGIVAIASASVFVLARALEITKPDGDGPATKLTGGWILVMIGGAAALAWAAIRFDLLGAEPRRHNEDDDDKAAGEELKQIASMLGASPLLSRRTLWRRKGQNDHS